jgi:hypothetical protein
MLDRKESKPQKPVNSEAAAVNPKLFAGRGVDNVTHGHVETTVGSTAKIGVDSRVDSMTTASI